MIEVRALSKTFYAARPLGASLRRPWQRGEPVVALHQVSLRVAPGDLVCLTGPNGAGKTTLLKILAGLIAPTAGTALVNGRDIRCYRPAMRAAIGYAPSEPLGFYDRLTGRHNLAFFAALYGLRSAQAARRIDELLEQFEVAAADRRYQEYSTGMKQRLVLARALLHDPPILLLDEPTRSLDATQTDRVHARLRRYREEGKTVLLTTHRAAEAEQLADEVVVLHQGRAL